MVIEELVAKLGLKVGDLSGAKKFIKALEDVKKASKEAGKGLKVNFSGSASGLGRITKDMDRAAASARHYRVEAERAARVRFTGRGPGTFPVGPGGGRGPGGGGKVVAVGGGGGGGGIGGLIGTAALVGTGAIALKKFGSLEQAVTELGITAGKSAAEMAPSVKMFETEGPKLGTTAQDLVATAQAFAAAGIDYDTAIKASLTTTKASKASFTKMDDAASAGIVTIQNLGVGIGDLGKAYDIMIAGGKLGKAEFKELASTMPQLASSGAKAQMKGTGGLRDLVAALEVVRESAPTTADAAIHLKDFLEKMSDPVTVKYFKKKAGVDVEKELKDADKKGQSRLDRMLDITGKYTKGDSFRLAELFHEQQSRDAIQQLITKRDKFNEYRKTIDDTAAGTTDTDLARVMDLFNSSVDKFSAAVDRLMTDGGALAAPAAKGALEVGSAALDAIHTGEGGTSIDNTKTLSKINALLGKPNEAIPYGSSGDPEDSPIFRAIKAGRLAQRKNWDNPVGFKPGGISRGAFGLGGGIGEGSADMMRQGAKETTTTITNTDTGNDHRTQSVSVTVHATGLAEVAAQVLSAVKSGLSSLGPSIAKTTSTPTITGATSAP